MSPARIATLMLASSALSLMLCPIALAEDDLPGAKVEYGETKSNLDHFRIKRDYTPQLYGSVERNKMMPATRSYQPMPATRSYQPMQPMTAQPGSIVQPNDYASNATVNTFVPPPPIVRPQNKYIWGQSAAGGYYDATGAVKELVLGDQLYRYGGKFMDGTDVPRTPVVCNFQGHVYLPYVVKR